MSIKKAYRQAARVQGILRILGARHEITIGELAEEFIVTRPICQEFDGQLIRSYSERLGDERK